MQDVIEEKLRQFEWGNYGLHEFEDSGNRAQHEWPTVLAAQIAEAVSQRMWSGVQEVLDSHWKSL